MLCLFEGPLQRNIADVWPEIERVPGLKIENRRHIQERTEGRFILGLNAQSQPDGSETKEASRVVISPRIINDRGAAVSISDFGPGISFGNGIVSGTKAIAGCEGDHNGVRWIISVVFPDSMESQVVENLGTLQNILEPAESAL